MAKAYPELTPTKQVEALRIISSCLVGGDGNEAHSDSFEVESGSLNVNYDLGYLLREGESLPSAITAPAHAGLDDLQWRSAIKKRRGRVPKQQERGRAALD